MARRRTAVDPEVHYRHLRSGVNWGECHKCGFEWPETKLRIRDGHQICPNHNSYYLTPAERDQKDAKVRQLAARLEAQTPLPKYPFPSPMKDVPAVSGISPVPPIRLARGGANVVVTLSGVNLTSADSISYSDPSVEDAVAPSWAADKKSVTLTVRAAATGGVNGDHDLKYNADVFVRIFEVRP